MNLHNRLKMLRQEKNLTQESLASAVGVTRQTIIAIEKEKFVPSVKLALLISRRLEAQLEQIFWLENNQGEEI